MTKIKVVQFQRSPFFGKAGQQSETIGFETNKFLKEMATDGVNLFITILSRKDEVVKTIVPLTNVVCMIVDEPEVVEKPKKSNGKDNN